MPDATASAPDPAGSSTRRVANLVTLECLNAAGKGIPREGAAEAAARRISRLCPLTAIGGKGQTDQMNWFEAFPASKGAFVRRETGWQTASMQIARRLAMAVCATLVGVVIVEIALRLTADPRSLIWRPGVAHVFHPSPDHFVGVEGPARFVVGRHGLRAPPEPSDPLFTIVALGGSTTECVYLDTGEAWPALLADQLAQPNVGDVWIGNGGKSGLSLRHHVLQVASVLEQFPRLDAMLLLIGGNDFLRYVGGRTEALNWREDSRAAIRVLYTAFEIPRRPSFGPLYERTEWIRHLRLAKRRLQRRLQPAEYLEIANDGRSYTTWRHIRSTATELVDTLPLLLPALDAFAADLAIIADLAERRGVELVVMTQPTMWAADLPQELQSLLWMGEIGNARGNGYGMYYTASALAEGMEQFNSVTKRICEERNILCIDLAGSLPKDTSVFYDDMHFNEQGAQQVAELVAPVLAGILTARTASDLP